jgi:hypothetical protein
MEEQINAILIRKSKRLVIRLISRKERSLRTRHDPKRERKIVERTCYAIIRLYA